MHDLFARALVDDHHRRAAAVRRAAAAHRVQRARRRPRRMWRTGNDGQRARSGVERLVAVKRWLRR